MDYHVRLLDESVYFESIRTPMQQIDDLIFPQRLTVSGHQFLEMMENDTAWNKAKSKLANTASGVGVELLKATLLQFFTG